MLPQVMEDEQKAEAPDASIPAINLHQEISAANQEFAISPALNVEPSSVSTSAIHAGAYRVGKSDYLLFVNSFVNNLPKNAPLGQTPLRFSAYAVKADSTKLNAMRAFKIGLPYSFAYNPIADSQVIFPIRSRIQDIKLRLPKSNDGPEPTVRGTLLAPKGKQISFLMTDIPGVKLYNPCEILFTETTSPKGIKTALPAPISCWKFARVPL